MRKALIACSLSAALLLGGCASIGGYFDNPQNDIQIAKAAFSGALTLYEQVCNASSGASFCSADNIATAVSLETAAQAALDLASGAFTQYAAGAATSADIETDIQNAVSAVNKFSDFVNRLQVSKTKAMAARMGVH